jgi:poly(A) polymerase
VSGVPGIVGGRLVDRSLLRQGPLQRAFAALEAPGEETRLVGGAVRDLACGERPGDLDLTTTLTPEKAMARAKNAGLQVVPTGVPHGTFTIVIDGRPIETTTLREDVETDGRHATVRFGRDFSADAGRRDFTINALSLDRDGKLYDYCGGLEDLAARKVRFIGDARQRIREDYLRILRFFRFSARFAVGPLDREGFAASIAERDGLAILSRERVRGELMKLIVAPRAGEVIEIFAETGLLGGLIAGVADAARLNHLIGLELFRAEPPDPVLRLGALAVRVGEDAERLRERLRLSNAETARLASSARACETLHGLTAPPTLSELWTLLIERGRDAARDAITFAALDANPAADPSRFHSAYRFLSDTPPPRLPFSGFDLLQRGVGPGQRVGAVLKKLQALWIRAGFPKEPEALARLLDEAARE